MKEAVYSFRGWDSLNSAEHSLSGLCTVKTGLTVCGMTGGGLFLRSSSICVRMLGTVDWIKCGNLQQRGFSSNALCSELPCSKGRTLERERQFQVKMAEPVGLIGETCIPMFFHRPIYLLLESSVESRPNLRRRQNQPR